MKPIVACGTSEGQELYKDDFGDAPQFHLYKIDARGFEFIEEVENISTDSRGEEEPEDEIKARDLTSLLKARSANVLLAHKVGPQIAEISRNFVPIISRELDIETALDSIRDRLHLVEREWRKGENREYLILGKS
jgi:predicted Fe-Mo cluster-binding NifX family protein